MFHASSHMHAASIKYSTGLSMYRLHVLGRVLHFVAGHSPAQAGLQDNVPSFDTNTALAIVEEGLGAPIDARFEDFNREPIAAASLGQVLAHAEGGRACHCVRRYG